MNARRLSFWKVARESFKEHETERIDIGRRAESTFSESFRRQEGGCSNQSSSTSQLVVFLLLDREPEVDDNRLAAFAHENVAGLQIAVDEALFMKRRKSSRDDRICQKDLAELSTSLPIAKRDRVVDVFQN